MVFIIRIILNSELYSIKTIQKPLVVVSISFHYYKGLRLICYIMKGIQINYHPNYFSSRLRYTMNGRVK